MMIILYQISGQIRLILVDEICAESTLPASEDLRRNVLRTTGFVLEVFFAKFYEYLNVLVFKLLLF